MSNTTQSSKLLFLNSNDGDRYPHLGLPSETSSFEVTLNESIAVQGEDTSIQVSLVSAEVPNSIYSVSGRNDIVNYSSNNGTPASITLAHGNYTVTSLLAYLKTVSQLTGFSSVAYDKVTNRFTWTSSVPFSFDFSSNVKNNARKLLGFSAKLHTASHSGTYKLTSDTVVDVTGGVRVLYVRSNLVSNNTIDSKNRGSSDILGKLQVNAGAFGIIMDKGMNIPFRATLPTKEIRSITVRLTDEEGNDNIELNGLSWSLTLQFDFVHGLHTQERFRDPREQHLPYTEFPENYSPFQPDYGALASASGDEPVPAKQVHNSVYYEPPPMDEILRTMRYIQSTDGKQKRKKRKVAKKLLRRKS